MKVGVIRNPASGKRAGRRLWPHFEQALARHLGTIEIVQTKATGDAQRLATALCDKGVDLLIAVGGDGTISEVVDGILRSTRPKTPFSFIRSGSGADFARNFDLADEPDAVVRAIAAAPLRLIDVGHLTCRGHDGEPTQRYFVNIASLGVSGRVAQSVNRHRGGFLLSGEGRFLLHSLRETWRYRPQAVRLMLDGDEVFCGPVTLIAAANGGWFGGGMRIAPGADLTSGYLEVVVVRAATRLKLLQLLNSVYSAGHLANPLVSVHRARSIEVLLVDGSDADWLPVDCDGESPGHIAARFDIVPAALNLKI
ncbi:MAG: diacylglycerol/lipid kinase family protein [Allorhizobium sp.]